MIALGQHWEFIAAAYGGCLVLVALLAGWTAIDARRARARVAALEAMRETQKAAGTR